MESTTTPSTASTAYEFTTIITTIDYVEGVVCLAKSLLLVKSKGILVCYCASLDISNAIASIIHSDDDYHRLKSYLCTKQLPEDVYDIHFKQDLNRDHRLFIDASRRCLFKLMKPFIFIDADIVAIQNFDEIFDYIDSAICTVNDSIGSSDSMIYGVPNFRNKKRDFNSSDGNFNAGLMIVPSPSVKDYNRMLEMLMNGYNDTEEKLLNVIFKDRWTPLPINYNMQKRCYRLAPDVFNSVKDSSAGIKVLHYVGGKPWQNRDQLLLNDWESKEIDVMVAYEALFSIWQKIRHNQYGGLLDRDCIPTAC